MNLPYLNDRASYDDAAELMSQYGAQAGVEALQRARQSREMGNHIHFCRWRQIERFISLMTITRPHGSIH